MGQGRFIVVEGLEGAGKSSAIDVITHYLNDKIKVPIITTREPGGTKLGELVRGIIKQHNPAEPLQDYSELLLLYAARVQLVEQVIRPALRQGSWVIADRFELSTFAYQGGGRNIDEAVIANLSQLSLQGFKPDLTLFLDITPEKGLQRAQMRGKTDRIEAESLAFFKRVYQAYHHRLAHVDAVAVIDGSEPIEVVQHNIRVQLQQFIDSYEH